MLMPKRTKYRKPHRDCLEGEAKGGKYVAFGEYGIQAMECAYITARQIEATRVAINRKMRKGGKVWIRIFPDMPYTKKPAETRQGNGKGAPEGWVAVVKTGTVMFEMAGVDENLAREALELAASKLPIKTKFIVRPEVE